LDAGVRGLPGAFVKPGEHRIIDFLALDHLTKRYDLPEIRFANDLGLWVLEPMGNGWLNALRPRTAPGDAANLERALSSGASAALFLKRPPNLLEASARGRIEGDGLVRALFEIQRRNPARLLLVPQVFVWSRSAGTLGGNLSNTLLGSSEWPGHVRSVAQFLGNRRHATLRAGEPVDLRDFLAREPAGASDDVLLRRLTYTLLRRLERERRQADVPRWTDPRIDRAFAPGSCGGIPRSFERGSPGGCRFSPRRG